MFELIDRQTHKQEDCISSLRDENVRAGRETKRVSDPCRRFTPSCRALASARLETSALNLQSGHFAGKSRQAPLSGAKSLGAKAPLGAVWLKFKPPDSINMTITAINAPERIRAGLLRYLSHSSSRDSSWTSPEIRQSGADLSLVLTFTSWRRLPRPSNLTVVENVGADEVLLEFVSSLGALWRFAAEAPAPGKRQDASSRGRQLVVRGVSMAVGKTARDFGLERRLPRHRRGAASLSSAWPSSIRDMVLA